MTTKTVCCTPCPPKTSRQVKAEIKKRLLQNPNSGPSRQRAGRAGKVRWERAWREFEALYREAPPVLGPNQVLSDWHYFESVDIRYAFFPKDWMALIKDQFYYPAVEKGNEIWFNYDAHLSLFERFLNRRLITLEALYRTKREHLIVVADTCRAHYIDFDMFCKWANKDLDATRTYVVDAVPDVGRLAPQTVRREHQQGKEKDPFDEMVPVMIALVIGVCAALLIYWNYRGG